MDLENLIYRALEKYWASKYNNRYGIVTSYDPKKHAAKVKIQPSGQESGWIPIHAHHVGNGWGVVVGLTPGDQVKLTHSGGDFEVAEITGRVHDDKNKPPKVESGEILLKHKNAGYFFLDKDKNVTWKGANGQITVTDKKGNVSVKLKVEDKKESDQSSPKHALSVEDQKGKKHSTTIDKDGINNTSDVQVELDYQGKHKVTVNKKGIKHEVDGGQHTVEIMSSGMGGMLGGNMGDLLSGANLGELSNALQQAMFSGDLSSMLSGGGLSSLLGGQLSNLLGASGIAQLSGEVSSLMNSGMLSSVIGGANGGVGSMMNGVLGGALGGGNTQQLASELYDQLSSGGLSGLLSGGGLGSLLNGQLGNLLGSGLMSSFGSELAGMNPDQLSSAMSGGIIHRSSMRVQVQAPQITHQGNMMVQGSIMAQDVIQSAVGVSAPIGSMMPGIVPQAASWLTGGSGSA